MTTLFHCPFCASSERRIILNTDGMNLVKCEDCSFIYLKDLPDESVLYEGYHEWTGFQIENYSAQSSDSNLKALWHINQQRIEVLKQRLYNGSLLDIGCGSGGFMLSAKEAGFEVTGIDVSEKAVEFISDELNLNASNEAVQDLEESFDVITLWHVLEHFIDPVSELKKIHERLNTDGVLFGEVPNWKSIKFQLSGKRWEGGNHPLYHRSFFTPQTLKNSLKEAGFSKVNLIHLPYTKSGNKGLYYLLKKGFNIFHKDAFLTFMARN